MCHLHCRRHFHRHHIDRKATMVWNFVIIFERWSKIYHYKIFIMRWMFVTDVLYKNKRTRWNDILSNSQWYGVYFPFHRRLPLFSHKTFIFIKKKKCNEWCVFYGYACILCVYLCEWIWMIVGYLCIFISFHFFVPL